MALFAPVFFTAAWLQYQKKAVKKEIKWKMIAGLDREELVLLKFSQRDADNFLRWEHPGEFEYLGEMYDVVERETLADSIIFWCWWDHEETRLNRQLKNLVDYAMGKDPLKKENGKRLYKFFSSLYFNKSNSGDGDKQAVFLFRFPEYGFSYYAIDIQPPSPPPRQG